MHVHDIPFAIRCAIDFRGDHAHAARAATSGPGLGLRRLALGRSGLAGAGAAPLEVKCYTKEGRPGRRPPH